ncbi:hypothetical protein [Halorarum halobium]|uniref:hypothetical protein n=1 Tax=Halorarum halobium TaxID=3075121 RepID=UPI0028AE269D|nr:hypothetical protein [Halobaculum sp. XH14]
MSGESSVTSDRPAGEEDDDGDEGWTGTVARAFAGVRRRPGLPVTRADLPWLGGLLAVGLAVVAAYLLTNPYPAYGAGLYTVIADAIRAAGYGLPRGIEGYTTEPVPVAYPPLALYGLAVLRDLGVGTFAAARYVPPLVTVAALVPVYLLGRDLLGRGPIGTEPSVGGRVEGRFVGRAAGAASALLVGLNPQVLEWHVSAGGLVRAPAFLFALSSAYAGLRLFRDRDAAWLPVALGTFTLTVLTHPTYTLFVVLTDLLFWVGYDRSGPGLLRGAAVGVGGAVLSAPWWLTVVSRHGPGVFAAAAGTHGGVGGGLADAAIGWSLVPLVAAGLLAITGWRVLPAWVLLAWVAFDQPRFVYAVGAFALVGVATECAGRFPTARPRNGDRLRRVAVAVLVCVAAVGVGNLAYSFAGATDPTTPSFVDDDDVAAMEWIAAETEPDATFVVLGDAAEWFPAVAERTILVAPWGAEWRTPETYDRQLGAFENASVCRSVGCLDAELATTAPTPAPDYLYVPRGGYTVRGDRHVQFGTLERSLELAGGYERVYANEGVVVYRVDDGTN